MNSNWFGATTARHAVVTQAEVRLVSEAGECRPWRQAPVSGMTCSPTVADDSPPR